MSYHDNNGHQNDAQAMPIRYPDTVYEYHSARHGIKWLLLYISVVSIMCFAAWIVLEMATPFVPRVTAILAIVIGLALGLTIARFFHNEDHKNRQATLRHIKTSR